MDLNGTRLVKNWIVKFFVLKDLIAEFAVIIVVTNYERGFEKILERLSKDSLQTETNINH